MILQGSVINGAAIVVGGLLGTWIGRLIPERMRATLMTALALITIGIAVPGLMKSQNGLIPILSMVLGTVIGELLNIDGAVNHLGEKLQKRLAGHGKVAEGFATGTMVFAVGAMAVMGALESGLSGVHTILKAKAVIDGVGAMVFATTLGIGVAFSGVVVFAVEGLMALLAAQISPFLGDAVIGEITFVGSLLIVAIALNVLGLTKLRVLNMLPAIVLPVILCLFM